MPYRFGSFSFQSYADKRRLVESGALADAEDWQLQKGFATEGLFDEATYSRCYAKYSHLHGTKLLQDVYRRYPYYAIKSERASKIMNDEELSAITAARPLHPLPAFSPSATRDLLLKAT